jgi:hypothetical protein
MLGRRRRKKIWRVAARSDDHVDKELNLLDETLS